MAAVACRAMAVSAALTASPVHFCVVVVVMGGSRGELLLRRRT